MKVKDGAEFGRHFCSEVKIIRYFGIFFSKLINWLISVAVCKIFDGQVPLIICLGNLTDS